MRFPFLPFPQWIRYAGLSTSLAFSLTGVRAEDPLNLLFFGNSFSQGGVQWRVADLAAADGHRRPVVLLDSLGGMDLTYHLNEVLTNPQNNVTHPLIGTNTWDYVILQEHSTKSTTAMGNPAQFQTDALAIYLQIKNHASGRGAGVQPILFQTWARADGNYLVDPNDYRSAWDSPEEMQADLSANYAAAASSMNIATGAGTAVVAPVGDAFASLDFNSALYAADLYHPSAAGTLLASMILYRTIYGEKVSDISYASASSWAGVNQATWNQLVATADAMAVVPEPSTATLVAVGFVLLTRRRRP